MRPETLILGWPPLGIVEGTALSGAPLLTEMDVLVVEPTFAALAQSYSEPQWKVVDRSPLPAEWLEGLSRRHKEIKRFLGRGGVLITFLGAPHSTFVSKSGRLHALELVAGNEVKVSELGIEEATGSSYELLDQHGPIASYLSRRPQWIATMKKGLLADDPFGFALATSQDGSIIAYQELVGAGLIFWLPPPSTEDQWRMLLICAESAWRERHDIAGEVALEEERQLVARIQELDRAHHEQRAALSRQREELRSRRLSFLAADAAVDRARRLFLAAQSYGPLKELDTYYQMLETIEQQYGGEVAGRQTLGYSSGLAAKITAPANQRRYAVRHPSQSAPEPLPPDVLEEARAAAREILRLFVDRRFEEWRRSAS